MNAASACAARVCAALFYFGVAAGWAAAPGDAKHGAYLAQAAGCASCHTEDRKGAVPYAGGRALKTPFGTFYGPNITPDPKAGIGRWTEADFMRALREGRRRDGANLYPAFPYLSFTRMTDADMRDLWAYLRTLPPSPRANTPHRLRFPYNQRLLLSAWKRLYFRPGPFVPDPRRSAEVNRGAYIVQALGHCGECHTPRNALGAPESDRYLAGGKGPDGKDVDNLTPTGLRKWDDGELKDFLQTGLTPAGDVVSATMDEVVRNATSKLTPTDLAALIAYLRSLPPLPDKPS